LHEQVKLEKEILGFWDSQKIYEKVKAQNQAGTPFYFCDGPPYATGQIHPGTAWNKCLKDAVCRYKRACGFNVRSQPGYDTHGLPIEVKVEQEMKLKHKGEIETIGVEKFVQRCKFFASEHMGVMGRQFFRCGVWMDWEKPYITYKDAYISKSWGTIKAAHDKGILQQGNYVVPYCTRCETTLANYELEYGEQDDPSLYVKFKVKGTENEYLVIWTTTPWTLVSNMAVMVHPTHLYVKVQVGSEVLIVAKERLDAVMAFYPTTSATVLGELSGKKLEGTRYEHPLQGKISKEYERKVVLSDEYVTLEDGSGLVHCAPGHGPEDFIVGKRFGIEIYSPIDNGGKFTKDAGVYEGIAAREANPKIIEDLDACGALIHAGKVRHRYPHCWRCKTPLIFIATPQWFITVSKFRERMHEEIANVKWKPDFALTRFSDFVSNAPDWCISRQRYWGIPLPIWKCEACCEIKVLGSHEELPEQPKELHRPYIDEIMLDCKCGGKMQRISDILDVWFDSGNAIWASLSKEDKVNPAYTDFIVEGKDQTRGWFYSLLGCGIVVNNQAPYKTVLMHGFFVDEKGEKMSKSVGNFVPLEEVVDKYGADAFRLWSLSNTIWDDLRFSWMEIKEAHRSLGILYNLEAFMERFYVHPKKEVQKDALEVEDKWMLSRLESVKKAATQAYEEYEPNRAAKALREFLVEDVSRFYMKLAKERMDGKNAQVVHSVLYKCLLEAHIMLMPIIPFMCEHNYQKFFKKYEKQESLALFAWPKGEPAAQDALLERQMEIAKGIIAATSAARMAGNIKLRWPLEEATIVCSETEISNAAERLSGIIEAMCNLHKIKIAQKIESSYSLVVNKAKVGAKFKQESAAAYEAIGKLSAADVQKWLSEGAGKGEKLLADGKYEVEREMVSVVESAKDRAIAPFDGGKVYLKTKISEELYAQAMVREAARRVQLLRKEMKLVENDKIHLWVEADKELEKILHAQKPSLMVDVNAKEITFGRHKSGVHKEFEIEESKLRICVEKEA